MQRITNISLSDRAAVLLRNELARFRPRAPGTHVFCLIYMSSYRNPDGTTVAGFLPGFAAGPWPAENAEPNCFVAHPIDGPDFVIVPPFKWRAADHYLVDIASDAVPTFSITAASGAPAR